MKEKSKILRLESSNYSPAAKEYLMDTVQQRTQEMAQMTTLYIDKKSAKKVWDIKKLYNLLLSEFSGTKGYNNTQKLQHFFCQTEGFRGQKGTTNSVAILATPERDLFVRIDKDYETSDNFSQPVSSSVLFVHTEGMRGFVEEIKKVVEDFETIEITNSNRIFLVVKTQRGYETVSNMVKNYNLDIGTNYNDDFAPVYEKIVNGLNTRPGLCLLHGEPGTGKSHLLRHLTTQLDKPVIFMPPNMTNYLSDPAFISFLMDNKDSVLVIEDAENVLKTRQGGDNQAMSNILNISDGLMSDVLNMGIVATFNCDVSELDSALMRPGRLIARYDFKKLSTEKAQKLSDKLGFKTTITDPMTVAEIYTQGDMPSGTDNKLRQSIGFSFNQ